MRPLAGKKSDWAAARRRSLAVAVVLFVVVGHACAAVDAQACILEQFEPPELQEWGRWCGIACASWLHTQFFRFHPHAFTQCSLQFLLHPYKSVSGP
jgi:hypothetical protein